ESMNRKDWEYLKNNREAQARIKDIISLFDRDRREAGLKTFDMMMNSPVYGAIIANIHAAGKDRASVYKALQNMTEEERSLYKKGKSDNTDPPSVSRTFADRVDGLVEHGLRGRAYGLFTGSERAFAKQMLANIENGKPPLTSVNDLVNKYATDGSLNKAELAKELYEWFKRDPRSFQNLKNGTPPEERKKFDEAIEKVFSERMRKQLIEPMLRSDHG